MEKPDHKPKTSKDEWRGYMQEQINLHVDDAPVFNRSWKILKPPQHLVEVKKEAYDPKLVTIGPLYPDLEESPINNFKAKCVKKFMERHRIPGVGELTKKLTPDQPDELSRIYNLLNLPQSDIDWLQLLVTVDTVFIHEFLLRLSKKDPTTGVCQYFTNFFFTNDFTFRNRLRRDLLLVGNQIPMSYVKKITEITSNRNFSLDVLEKTVQKFIVPRIPFISSKRVQARFEEFLKSKDRKLMDKCKHLLDALYYSCTETFDDSKRPSERPPPSSASYSEEESHHIPTASQLSKAGISFKACEGNVSVMKYDMKKLQLHLPRLVVYDSTEDVLRNLLAYEQTFKDGGEFTMYAVIMDSLIDNQEDLGILTKAKVIENQVGNDKRLIQMWNNMGTNVYYEPCKEWKEMIHEINAHNSSRWRRLYVEFYQTYLSRPWLVASVIAAFLLLSASIFQTVYSILGYYKP